MRKSLLAVLIGVVALVGVTTASAASDNGNQLTCFEGAGGDCTLIDGGAQLTNVPGGFSGVYLQNSNVDGKRITTVNQLGFRYTGVATAGAPRISLPIDTDADGDAEFYAFIAAFYCNDGAGLVDAINDPTCTIFAGAEVFANWDALVAAHPEWRVSENQTFVIADEPGTWTVTDVELGKGPAKGAK